jgi:ATPase subunit of ABC transporter with duplicated ATPase domains
MDEPSNHLDAEGRQLLYDFIKSTSKTLIVVSHDRELLNLLDQICEIKASGISVYGGDFEFYLKLKKVAENALENDIQSSQKALRKAKEKERVSLERKQKHDSRGKNKQGKAGVARIMMNTLRNNAENSTSKIKDVHAVKISQISDELQELRANRHNMDKMKLGFEKAFFPKGKVLIDAININFRYGEEQLWKEDLIFQIRSGIEFV